MLSANRLFPVMTIHNQIGEQSFDSDFATTQIDEKPIVFDFAADQIANSQPEQPNDSDFATLPKFMKNLSFLILLFRS